MGEKGSKQAKRRKTEPTGQNRLAMWHGHTVPHGTVQPCPLARSCHLCLRLVLRGLPCLLFNPLFRPCFGGFFFYFSRLVQIRLEAIKTPFKGIRLGWNLWIQGIGLRIHPIKHEFSLPSLLSYVLFLLQISLIQFICLILVCFNCFVSCLIHLRIACQNQISFIIFSLVHVCQFKRSQVLFFLVLISWQILWAWIVISLLMTNQPCMWPNHTQSMPRTQSFSSRPPSVR